MTTHFIVRKVILGASLSFTFILLASINRPGIYYDTVNNSTVKDMVGIVQEQRYQLNNHEEEIRMIDEKLKNLDVIIDALREEYDEINSSQKNQLKSHSSTISEKIASIDALLQGLINDIKQFKVHAQEVDTILAVNNKKITALENTVAMQADNIVHLQEAISSVINAVQSKEVNSKEVNSKKNSQPKDNSGNTYVVKNGDSLEKIARKFETTVQAVKELNGLTNDRIVVGKSLQIPEK